MYLVRPAAAWLSPALNEVPCRPWPVVSLRQSSYRCHSQHLCNKVLTAVTPSISVTKFLQWTYLAPLWQKFLQLLYPSPLRQSSYDWHAKRLCDNVLVAVIQISYDWYTQQLCDKFLMITIHSTSVTKLLSLTNPAPLWQILTTIITRTSATRFLQLLYPAPLWQILTTVVPSTSMTNSYNCHNQHLWQGSYDCHTQHLSDKVFTNDIYSTSVTNLHNCHTQHLCDTFVQLPDPAPLDLWQRPDNGYTHHFCHKVLTAVIPSTSVTISYNCHTQHLCDNALTIVIPSASVTKFLQLLYPAPPWQMSTTVIPSTFVTQFLQRLHKALN